MTASSAAIDGLKQARPDWGPWLDVLDEIGRECAAPVWARMVPSCSPQRGVPL